MRAMTKAMGGVLVLLSLQAQAKEACAVRSATRTVPLIELYTSEGCSSCPPADRWFSRRLGQGDANGLAFHVDYWDDIGWPDRFASAAYTRRQRARVAATGGSTVYTPQVMLGADVRAGWRADRGFDAAVRQASEAAPVGLALQLQRSGPGWRVRLGAARAGAPAVGARASVAPAAQVWLASYVDGQTTQVGAGENRGVTLRHDHVVRQLWGPWPLGAAPLVQTVEVPAETAPWGVLAFVQAADGRVLQSLDLPQTTCTAADG